MEIKCIIIESLIDKNGLEHDTLEFANHCKLIRCKNGRFYWKVIYANIEYKSSQDEYQSRILFCGVDTKRFSEFLFTFKQEHLESFK